MVNLVNPGGQVNPESQDRQERQERQERVVSGATEESCATAQDIAFNKLVQEHLDQLLALLAAGLLKLAFRTHDSKLEEFCR